VRVPQSDFSESYQTCLGCKPGVSVFRYVLLRTCITLTSHTSKSGRNKIEVYIVTNKTEAKALDAARRTGDETSGGIEGNLPRCTIPESNIETILRLEREALEKRSVFERISDRIATFTGTNAFIVIHIVWFTVWILLNINLFTSWKPFDPYPFGLLTVAVSLEAIFLSTFVLISQNRMSRQAERRAHLDLQINLLAEQETTHMLNMLHKISKRLGITCALDDDGEEALLKKTDLQELVSELDEKLGANDVG
jgi:uncharacterized membrane protein